MIDIYIGIDPGSNTGFCIYGAAQKKILALETIAAYFALERTKNICGGGKAFVVMEDARLRKWYGTERGSAADAARKQGAGAIKRECAIWEEMLRDCNIPHLLVSPQAKGAKLTAPAFARVTGWIGRSSEHARDAAMLVWGRSPAVCQP